MTTIQNVLPVGAGHHVVQFYEHQDELAHSVGRYLADAVQADGIAVIIATEAHRGAFMGELAAAGVDLSEAISAGTVVMLDAAATMARFMRAGEIDAEAFRSVVGAPLRNVADRQGPVSAYGEMVALLWDAGNVLAAVELEDLWNQLGAELQFSLVCGYQSSALGDLEHADALEQVCRLHSSVIHSPPPEPSLAQTGEQSSGSVSREFLARAHAPGEARRFVGDTLRQWGFTSRYVQDAQLVVSELATNAVVHAGSPFTVLTCREGSGVRITVQDDSPRKPVLRSSDSATTTGRGLHLVTALTRGWGVDAMDKGKAVWAVLPGRKGGKKSS